MKKISRRNFLLASGVVTIGAALTACGGSSSTSTAASSTASSAAASEAPAAGGKTLNIWCWNDEFQSRFNDYYPEVAEIAADKSTTTLKDGTIVKWTINPNDNNNYQNKLDEALLKQDSAAYMQSANRDTVLLCQIESQLGVSNIDAIMAVDGIDGAMIGPNDMSQDFGILGQYAHPAMQAAFRQVIDAAARHGKVSGAHFGAAAPLQPWLSQGMTLNMCSSDLGLLMSGAKELSCLR